MRESGSTAKLQAVDMKRKPQQRDLADLGLLLFAWKRRDAVLLRLRLLRDLLNKQIVADTTRRATLMALRVKLLPLLQRGETVAEAASAVLEKSSA